MARIRTIKPEFFTSDDICALSPLARLLYIGTWLEADREGRLTWKPNTLKTRYLPHDDCDIRVVCTELLQQGLVVLYGNGFAYIPTFSEHQFVNPRESQSKIRPPSLEEMARVTDASLRVSDAPSLPSVPFHSLPSQRSAPLIVSPAAYARKLEFCAFVGSRLEVPKSLHGELRTLLGGENPEARLQAWYLALNDEIDESGESIAPDVFKWLKARYALWAVPNGAKTITDEINDWAKS
jgi:hypothetical protein